MGRTKILAVACLGLCGSMVLAVDSIEVPGSSTRYATPIVSNVAGKQVTLVLTGTALRKKYFVNVYTIGSYVQEGIAVRTPEELSAINCAKSLHLVMERDVAGKEMAEAFRVAIHQNYAVSQFADEINTLVQCISAQDVHKGDQVWLTHIPGVGLYVNLVGKTDVLIKNLQFSQAVWDIYLGKNNLGDAIKKGLVSRL
jgi:Chalcone isomerase-like